MNSKWVSDNRKEQELLACWNDTDRPYRLDRCLHEWFEDQALRHPDSPAVRYQGQGLTYADLDAQSNRCAWYLRSLGIGPGSIVGLLQERSCEMVVALLGILKSGGAYMPLDPSYPAERLRFMLEDAGIGVVLTMNDFAPLLEDFEGTAFCMDGHRGFMDEHSELPLTNLATPDSAAYVIYTSGSTGKPKGCILPHRAICNRLLWMQEEYRLTERDKVLQKTPYTFDVSVWEFFWPLVSGASFVLSRAGGHKYANYLIELIQREEITTCHFVPSMLRFFLSHPGVEGCTSLKRIYSSGEELPYDLMTKCFERLPGAALYNLYGPTEAAVDVTHWTCEERLDRKVPIGRAIANTRLYVLDESMLPVLPGEEGELYIGGVQVALGYLNRPELTAERFLPDPFGASGAGRLYRTGDRVCYLPDGCIEYKGRIDDQVKIRGNRLELGEVEASLRSYDFVKDAAVAVKDRGNGDPRLIAYVIPAAEDFDPKLLRQYLKDKLPEYAVPNKIVLVEQMPVTAHGKLDRKALPWPSEHLRQEPEGAEAETPEAVKVEELRGVGTAEAAPAFSTGPALAEAEARGQEGRGQAIASELLRFIQGVLPDCVITLDEDLFDLGATSLTLVQMVEHTERTFGVSVPVELLLEGATIQTVSDYVAGQMKPLPADASVGKTPDEPEAVQEDGRYEGIGLLPARFRPEAYEHGAFRRSFGSEVVSSASFGGFMSLLRAQQPAEGGEHKFLYPSAGGANAVQTYLLLKKGAVEGVPGGLYFYDPSVHALRVLSAGIPDVREAFAVYDREAFDKAGFAVFLIAHMDAIVPTYRAASPMLVTLDAGYMAQLMIGRQSGYGIAVSPVVGVDFGLIRPHLNLEPSKLFIHCLLGGAMAEQDGSVEGKVPLEGLYSRLKNSSTAFLAHFADSQGEGAFSGFYAGDAKEALQGGGNTPEGTGEGAGSEGSVPYASDTAIPLAVRHFDRRWYSIRSSRREYIDAPVAFAQFSRFMGLLQPVECEGRPRYLYPSVSGTFGLTVYLYVKEGGIEGLGEGVYRYDSGRHTLIQVTGKPSKAFKLSYTPFNRKHYADSRFCLYLTADLDLLRPLYGDSSLHLAFLESGYIGQYLLDHQAEFDMGLCPIGGMHFERIRGDFQLRESQVLLHSFTCGTVLADLPPGLAFLEAERGKTPEPVEQSGSITVETAAGSGTERDDIAIVGVSGRYPGARNPEELWENLRNGVTSFSPLSEERQVLWGSQRNDGDLLIGGFLDEIDAFDSLFFQLSPAEARFMDPQERQMLEVAWECLEDAGYTPEGLNQSVTTVGVFIGAMWNDYQNQCGVVEGPEDAEASALHSTMANRISYFFDFNGPSLALNTSCSSAMTALHLACESIRKGECGAAVVGGVNLITHQYHRYMLERLQLISRKGECRPFGAGADGWILGEGAGALLLKPLSKAEADRDWIYGVIKGTAVGHTGKTPRFSAPSSAKQADIINRALGEAGIQKESVSYIEAAAPGASLADVAEMEAVKKTFTATDSLRYVGSIKGNIGHLESASAISQITKVLMQMKYGGLAPSLNSHPSNPLLRLEGTGLAVNDVYREWPSAGEKAGPVRAIVHAWGATGSGGVLLLESYPFRPEEPQANEEEETAVIPLSATTAEQLQHQVRQLHVHLLRNPNISLIDVAYTWQTGRKSCKERLAIIARSRDELLHLLERYLQGELIPESIIAGTAAKETENTTGDGSADSPLEAARIWARGGRPDWRRHHKGAERRIPLPTYPFSKDKHWVRDGKDFTESAPDCVNPAVAEDHANVDYGVKPFKAAALFYLKGLLSKITRIPAAQLDAQEHLENYGIGSVMIHALNGRMREDLGELPQTLFFDCRNLEEMALYIAEHHGEQLVKCMPDWFGRELHAIVETAESSVQTLLPPSASKDPAAAAAGDIAVVGLAGTYPKAPTLRDFWNNLVNGVDCITEIPKERWNHDKFYDMRRKEPLKAYSKWGGFINDVDKFDPLFFNISPREAERMDPQERLFLETAWHVFEDAGYSRQEIKRCYDGAVGVFVGVMYGDYQLLNDRLGVISSYGSIANRVSYVLDLHGPSMAVDTLCSSSLTALQLAVESIRRGECRAAVAGGVNLSLHPYKYLAHSQLQMSSSDGKCRSFGDGGDGFVPGEGVGAVLVKPLADAIRDGDHIYGVIKGISVNHGGKTNGYTVPSSVAQRRLIADALAKSQVNPRSITYVEAHGTGTALGDPIEIAGLSESFGEYTRDLQFCSIGSVKSNIGHLEGAAGIAGLTKVLLQMKYGQLVPSLHADETNPNIAFEKTPFFVQRTLTEWPQPDSSEMPEGQKPGKRTACVSSFGAGGANAHVILEEFEQTGEARHGIPQTQPVCAILLSARSVGPLKELARNLLDTSASEAWGEEELLQAAFTLQIGREALEERLAFTVRSVQELQDHLRRFVADGPDDRAVYRGRVKDNREAMQAFMEDEELREATAKWMTKRKYPKLLEFWVKGLEIDWRSLYQGREPKRMQLPLYPFLRERYWIPTSLDRPSDPFLATASLAATEGAGQSRMLHPLLHRNVSDLAEQRYRTLLSGHEPFLTDHIVNGNKVLPGAAYLEMARAAVQDAARVLYPGRSVFQLYNVKWQRPVTVQTQPVELQIVLEPGEMGRISFEVCSLDTSHEIRTVCCAGEAAYTDGEGGTIDIGRIMEDCCDAVFTGDQCYESFERMGIQYGAAHRGIQSLQTGKGQAFARLGLPGSAQASYVIHPGIADSAIQASVGLAQLAGGGEPEPALPVLVEEVIVFRPCEADMFVWVRQDQARSSGSCGIRTVDITLCGLDGTVHIEMKGVGLKVLEGRTTVSQPMLDEEKDIRQAFVRTGARPEQQGACMLEPLWKSSPLQNVTLTRKYDLQITVYCDLDLLPDSYTTELENLLAPLAKNRRSLLLCSEKSCIAQRYESYAGVLLEELQQIERDYSDGSVLIQLVAALRKEQQQVFRGLAALLRTACMENPRLTGQWIETDSESLPEPGIWAKTLIGNGSYPDDRQIAYRGEERCLYAWEEHQHFRDRLQPVAGSKPLWKDYGVYLITGGLGKIALTIAEDAARRTQGAILVLSGRTEPDGGKRERMKRLEDLGATVVFRQADIANPQAAALLVRGIVDEFGRINGIIHAAGMLKDSLIRNKHAGDFSRVLAPKVSGLVQLDLASRDIPLDWFVMFGSINGIFGNPGQSDYAAANAFMHEYALYRHSLVAAGRRTGTTLCMNWPLWREGGMQTYAAHVKERLSAEGLVAMETSTALRALDWGLMINRPQWMVLEGDLERIVSRVNRKSLPAELKSHGSGSEALQVQPAASEGGTLPQSVNELENQLRGIISAVLKVTPSEVDVLTEWSEYGFDSVTYAEMAERINRKYGLELTPALFFEYTTVQALAGYLASITLEISAPGNDRREAAAPERSFSKAVDLLEVEAAIVRSASNILKVRKEDMNPGAEWSEYGFDSITLSELATCLNQQWNLELTPALFYEHTTISRLGAWIAEEWGRAGQAFPKLEENTTIPSSASQVSSGAQNSGLQTENRKRRVRFIEAQAAANDRPVPGAGQAAQAGAVPITAAHADETAGQPEPVAIVGISGAFPMARDIEEFWHNLWLGKDCITEIPEQRWDWRQYDGNPLTEANKTDVRWGGFIEGVDEFNPAFFGISPKEALFMDPQQRLLMTHVWKAMEDAGVSAQSLSGTPTAMFVGTAGSGYSELISRSGLGMDGYTSTGMASSMGPNRMSYFLNLHGPSEPVETACSSSLVAVHRAVELIQNGSCEMAFAGGINTILAPASHIMFSKAGMLSKDGRCKTFDADANGYVRGEGVGILLLRRLKDAEREGNPIYGVIRGSAVNHGGRAASLTAPNPKAQADLLAAVYRKAGIDPQTIGYIEAHGTGTELGDPVEINGLKAAFRKHSLPSEANGGSDEAAGGAYCGIGSVKSNIGHLELAAGAAGLIKVLLQMKHGTLVKTLHCNHINPYIKLDDSPFYIVRENQKWARLKDSDGHDLPRRAGVSSFGFGGVNSHVLVEEYMPSAASPVVQAEYRDQTQPELFLLSAKTGQALLQRAEQLLREIRKPAYRDGDLPHLAYTLQTGREPMEERLAFTAGSLVELERKLESFMNGDNAADVLFRGQIKSGKEMISLIAADEDMQMVIDTWMAKHKYKNLLELWVKGLNVDWGKMYPADCPRPRLLSLPTYPFAQEHYWVPQQPSLSAAGVESPAVNKRPEQAGAAGIRDEILSIIAAIVGLPPLDIAPEEALRDYGLDSIGSLRLAGEIKSRYGVVVTPKELHRMETGGQIVEKIASGLRAAEQTESAQGEADADRLQIEPEPPSACLPGEQLTCPAVLSLSSVQTGMWFLQALHPESAAYHIPNAFRVPHIIDVNVLENAVRRIVERHPLLRSHFVMEEDGLVNRIGTEPSFLFEHVSAAVWSGEQLYEEMLDRIRRPFDLEKGPLLNVYLFSQSPSEHLLLLNVHHLIFDGTSLQVFIDELQAFYREGLTGAVTPLPKPPGSYADYVNKEQVMVGGELGKIHQAYWRGKLSGELMRLELPFDYPACEGSPVLGRTVTRRLTSELSERLYTLGLQEKVSAFVIFLSAFKVLLHRYCNAEDILIGTALDRRPDAAHARSIGNYINMAVIRSQVKADMPFRHLLQQMQDNALEALEHGDYPFIEVVKDLQIREDRGSAPLTQISFVFHNWYNERLSPSAAYMHPEDGLLQLEYREDVHQEGEYDLTLEVIRLEGEYSLVFKYNPALFKEETIARLAGHYIALLKSAAGQCDLPAGGMPMLSEEETAQIKAWNLTEADYPYDRCVHELFEEQVKLRPNAVAVRFGTTSLTYDELNRKANQLARRIRSSGSGALSVVGVVLERSLEMMVGLLGVIKAGAAYLPIDPGYPEERILYLLENSGAKLVVLQRQDMVPLPDETETIALDSKSIFTGDDSDLPCITRPEDLVYVIYTSGSTGKPKGVMIEHRSLVNRLKWTRSIYPIAPGDVLMQKTPYTFDCSVWELFCWALEGAELTLLPPQAEKDPQAIADTVRRDGVTLIHFVPSMLSLFLEYVHGSRALDDLSSIRRVFTTGEALTVRQVKLFNETMHRRHGTLLVNLYGPTETTIEVSFYECPTAGEFTVIPIGKPIHNHQLYVLNPQNCLQPVGFTGELCIAGSGVARGYINNPRLTAERFVDNPFEPGTKMYRTGDLAKWLADGNIEYLGRNDRQVKIRGVRLELGEIEAALLAHEQVREACVIVDQLKDMTGNDRLKAYYVTAGGHELSQEDLKPFLYTMLPEYMVPVLFEQLDEMPLTAHGKADFNALHEGRYVPRTPLASGTAEDPGVLSPGSNEPDFEAVIAGVYSSLLQLDTVSPEVNFFDLGGHSMLLVKAGIQLREALNREITPAELFQYPTVRSLAGYLQRNQVGASVDTGMRKGKGLRELLKSRIFKS